jgi:hypothetical protein
MTVIRQATIAVVETRVLIIRRGRSLLVKPARGKAKAAKKRLMFAMAAFWHGYDIREGFVPVLRINQKTLTVANSAKCQIGLVARLCGKQCFFPLILKD